jgi:alkaline phosphatase D
MPFPKALRPRGPDMRIVHRLDWGTLARFHLLDDRQYRDVQACPKFGRGGANVVLPMQCPTLADPKRTLLGAEQERWLADGWDRGRPWNLVAQQTLMARYAWTDPPTVWTDGWDGYPAARRRLLDGLRERRLGGVIVLGGDVHSNYVADLKSDFDAADAPVLATEFCGTSISSRSTVEQERIDAVRERNPHVKYARSDERGYVRFTLDAKRLHAQLRVVADPLDAKSACTTAASFVVEAGRPGAIAETRGR